MRALSLIFLVSCTTAAPAPTNPATAAASQPAASPPPAGQVYPKPPQADVRETHFGVEVSDPFRPLEDLNSPETRAWVEAEDRLTAEHLAHIPGRDALRARLVALGMIPVVTPPVARS